MRRPRVPPRIQGFLGATRQKLARVLEGPWLKARRFLALLAWGPTADFGRKSKNSTYLLKWFLIKILGGSRPWKNPSNGTKKKFSIFWVRASKIDARPRGALGSRTILARIPLGRAAAEGRRPEKSKKSPVDGDGPTESASSPSIKPIEKNFFFFL